MNKTECWQYALSRDFSWLIYAAKANSSQIPFISCLKATAIAIPLQSVFN